MWEVNVETLEVEEPEFAKETIVLTPEFLKSKVKTLAPVRKKIIVKEGFYYTVAINKKNALKHYQRALDAYLKQEANEQQDN